MGEMGELVKLASFRQMPRRLMKGHTTDDRTRAKVHSTEECEYTHFPWHGTNILAGHLASPGLCISSVWSVRF